MNKFFASILAIMFSISCWAEKPNGVNSALSWLQVIDSGSYEKSWQQAAPLFQNRLSSDQWQESLNNSRAPFGNVLSRTVKSTKSHSSLPGVPDGEYMVIKVATIFKHKKSAAETITVSKVDDEWRTVGYFIK